MNIGVVALCLLLCMSASAQVFVVPGGAGSQNGTSWANAYDSIEDAITDARAPEADVWVAAGAYLENLVDVWPANVSAYGGFAGNESSLSARDWANNETIIDGNNAERVIRIPGGRNNVRIDGFTIQNGVSTGFEAGGFTMWGGSTNVVIINCKFLNNGSEGHGGAMTLQSASPRIENCVFDNNRASGIASCILINDGAAPMVVNSTFRNHPAGSWNGPIVMRDGGSHGTFVNCLFENNVGGALSFRDGGESNLTAIGCYFKDNVNTGSQGGAIRVPNAGLGNALIQDCTFEGNIATHGGAVGLWDTEKIVTIERSVFIGNESIEHGAAVVTHAKGTVNIENSVFMENHATGISSAVFAWHQPGAVPTTYSVNYCTFYGNTGGQGFTVRADGVSASMHNSIVWANAANGVNVPTTTSIIQGGAAAGLDADPLFVDPLNDDFRLQAASPAIGMGVDWPETDILGVARPQGDAADVGAYEFEALHASISGPSTAVVGQNVNLQVNHNAYGDATIVWMRDGEILVGEEFNILPLGDVVIEDSGVYSVTVTSINGEASAVYNLNVVSGLPVASLPGMFALVLCMVLAAFVVLRGRVHS